MDKIGRVRYIPTAVKPEERVCMQRIYRNGYRESHSVGHVTYRVHIPDDMELEWDRANGYYATSDTRRIKDLEYEVLVTTWDGKRKILDKGANIEAEIRLQKACWRAALERAAEERKYRGDSDAK